MERWQWQVVEAVYAAAQGKKEEAVDRLKRLELLFRKTGHVAAEITATGCRGVVLASMNNPKARQPLMRSVYLAQEQNQQQQQQQAEEEVAAAVADKCALMLSWVVAGEEEYEEAVGWYRLQRAPEMTVPRFRLLLVTNLLLLMRTHGRELGFRTHEAHLQVREAAREAMMMSTSMRDNEPHLVRDILFDYETVAEAAAAAVVETQQLYRAVEILREALALGSSSSSAGLLSIGDGLEFWQQWARTREEFIWYRMGRLLFKLRQGDDANLAAEALAMFANSLQCALQDDRWPDEECESFPRPEGSSFSAQVSHDKKCVVTRANACYWAGHLIHQILTGTCPPEQLAQCSVLREVAAPPISRSLAMRSLVCAAVALIRFPQWQGVMMGHIETVLLHLVAPESSGSSNRSGGADASNSLLFGCTHSQPRCRILLSEDAMLEEGLFRLLAAMSRSGEEAADAEELDAAVDWYHKAAEVARVLPPGRVADPVSRLSYRIGELQYLAGAWMESLEMLSNCLRHVLLAVSDTVICLRTELRTNDTGPPETPRHVTKAVILVHRLTLQILTPMNYERQEEHGRVLQDADVVVDHICRMPVVRIQMTLGNALCGLSKPEGVRLLEAAHAAAMLQMELDGVSGRDVGLAGEEFTIHGLNLYDLQIRLAGAYSKVTHDSSKAAQMYELCRDMATLLHNRLSMQLRAAREWERAGDLLSAQEAVLEALDVLVPPGHASNSNSEVTMSNMLWGSPSDSSLEVRAQLLANAAFLVEALWPREPKPAKRKAALEALWELCRSPANNLDVYLKNFGILQSLMLLVDVYQNDAEWAAAEGLLDALAPRLKDLYHKDTPQWINFEMRHARGLRHSRHYLQAATVFKDLLSSASEDIDDATGTAAKLLLSSAYDYKLAGQHQLAAKMLNRLERMIRATTSWPPPGPGTNDVDPKQNFEFELCSARAGIAMETGRYDELVIWLHKAASLQEAIINDIQQRQLPVAKHLRTLVSVLTLEANIYNLLNEDDVKGLEARIERIQTLDPDAGTVCEMRALLLLAKGDREEAVESMRELFLLKAESQEGRGGDDDSWITDYGHGGHCISLWMVVYLLELIHIGLGQNGKALVWAERGRMRLFMHRVHAQQHQEDDPEWAMDSTPNDFDRDDEKALDMLVKVLLACGPNVALLEYSYFRHPQRLRAYCLLVAGFESPSISRIGVGSITLDCSDIEQLVKKARDSIIARPQQKGEAAAATNKKRHARQQLRYLAQLHSLLVAPVLKELPDSCDTLIFVPDGYLSLVPFAALYDESAGQFLIQQKQVVVAPCLRALSRCLGLQNRFFSAASTLQPPFVAGNPCPMGLGMPQLPHAQEEATAVADILGVKPCLGAAVTKEAVVEALCHSSVVLLATHASARPPFPAGAVVLQAPKPHDPDVASSSSSRASTSAASDYDPPLLRAIRMYPDSDEPEAALLMRGLLASVTEKSQVLTAHELSAIRIRAGLVVLSACETGRGEVTPEGVLGLGRALLQAGAATTVLSLWKVDDQATKRLITEMFQELQKGEPVGTALRKAMLKMIQEGSSISHWAPFFIFGSPTMHLRNVTTLKAKKKMNGSSPELELGDGMQQVQRPTSDATRLASSADDQAAVQAVLVGSHESAWLDSSTGAICRRLFPRGLNISWGDAEQYWTWRTLDSSTNSNEVAVLKQVCWLDLRGRIKGALTPGTVYTLSWRLGFAPFTTGLNEHPVRFFLDTSDGQHHVVDAYLNSSSSRAGPRSRVNILRGEDGWHEYEVADFSVPAAAHGHDELEVAFGMWEHTGNWKCGLYVDSVVLRPRQALSSNS